MIRQPLKRAIKKILFFRAYSALCFSLFGKTKLLLGGRALFELLSQMLHRFTSECYLKLALGQREVFVDLFDPRFFQVVNELTSPHSDVQVLHALLSEGDSFIDIGANHGSFSIVASEIVGVQGSVTAVEAQPRLAKAVEQSLFSNAPCDFQVHQVAVGASDGEIQFLVPKGSSGSAGIYSQHSATQKHDTFKVAVRRFDDLVDWRSLPGQVLVKLDIEGSELEFLAGAKDMVLSRQPTLIIEVHPGTLKAAGKTGEDLKQVLQELGYKRYSELEKLEESFPIEALNTQLQRNVVAFTT